jgi:hypothetical protein
MATRRSPRLAKRGDRFTEKTYKPYTSAIGQFVLAWNDLHEKLGLLFVAILVIEQRGSQADIDDHAFLERWSGLWSAPANDRPKRDLLRALLNPFIEFDFRHRPRFVEDISWVLDKTIALEGLRNDAVHAPLTWIGKNLVLRLLTGTGELDIVPNVTLGNQRALSLAKKDHQELAKEFRWGRDTALALRDFTDGLHAAVSYAHNPWPRRPSMPNRRPKRKRPQAQRPAPEE